MLALSVVLVCAVACAAAAPLNGAVDPNAANRITFLPGLNPQPSYAMYSGYIVLDNNQHLFYWLIEAETNANTAPLMLWLNGGPGCSSLLGLFEENGPFRANASGDLNYFRGNWNQYANMLYLESPSFVGYSYWPGHPNDLTKYSDESTVEGNHEFLTKWIKQYTQYQNRPFVIAGESYAGHYIPELVHTLINDPIPGLNFQGFAIGNPYVAGSIDDGPLLDQFLMSHAVKSLRGEGKEYPNGLDPYDVLADTCDLSHARFPTRWNGHQWGISAHEHINTLRQKFGHGKARYVPNPLPDCVLDVYTDSYLRRVDVQQAIHATPPNPNSWSVCSYGVYVGRADTTIPYIVEAMNNTDLTIWIYSGDEDYVCNFISTEWWILDLNRTEVSKWSSWLYTQPHDGSTQIAGFTTVFDRITYRTVKGAGHEVPRLQPAPALQMLQDFLNAAIH
jgi:serine carboxypeptidase-like clade 2